MAVPFNDTRRRFAPLRRQLKRGWEDFLDRGIFIGGPLITHFERTFADYIGAKHCIAVANGTDALELALRATGVQAGHEVITVANAGGYTTTACLNLGATPVYVDVDTATAQLSTEQIELGLSSTTKAIVVTHLYGLMNDVARVRSRLYSLDRADIVIIEDCAQAHGAELAGIKAGYLAEASAFSFYPTKNLGALGDAGAVICSDSDLAQKIKQLSQYGWDRKYHSILSGGRNSRMDPLQAMILNEQLSSLPGANEVRRQICSLYAKNLKTGWAIIHSDSQQFVGHLAVLIAPSFNDREHARLILGERGVGHDIHYPLLDCDQPAWEGRFRMAGELPISRLLTRQILSIPCFPEMTDDEKEQVVDAIRRF